jgi:hypothetical protein
VPVRACDASISSHAFATAVVQQNDELKYMRMNNIQHGKNIMNGKVFLLHALLIVFGFLVNDPAAGIGITNDGNLNTRITDACERDSSVFRFII